MWKPGVERRAVAAEPLDDERALLRHDDRRPRDDEDDAERRGRGRRSTHPTAWRLPLLLRLDPEREPVDARRRGPRSPRASDARRRSGRSRWCRAARPCRRRPAAGRPSTDATSPDERVDLGRRGPAAPSSGRAARGAGSDRRARSTVKRSHWSQAGRSSMNQTSAPTTTAPTPKKRKKNPPGVSISQSEQPEAEESPQPPRHGGTDPRK